MEKTEDHFSLKWSNFRSSLTEGFHDFLREEMMVDVTLAAEGKFVQAHKLVLSVCSPYFKNLFKVNPCKHPIVILKDVGHNELSYMLQFMYKGEVGVKHEDLSSFLKLADMLKVKGLVGGDLENPKKNFSTRIESTMGKVRKKKYRNQFSDTEMDNTGSQKPSEKSKDKKMMRSRKRRWTAKSESVVKVKKEKFENETLDSSGLNVSDSDDENPLVKLISDKVNSGESSKSGDFLYGLKNGFSGVNDVDANEDDGVVDDVEDDNDVDAGNADDFNISSDFIPSENATESDQAPQGVNYKSSPGKNNTKRSMRHTLRFQGWGHFPERVPPTNCKQNPAKRCHVCSKHGIRRETTWQCKICKVALHIPECFENYHVLQDY